MPPRPPRRTSSNASLLWPPPPEAMPKPEPVSSDDEPEPKPPRAVLSSVIQASLAVFEPAEPEEPAPPPAPAPPSVVQSSRAVFEPPKPAPPVPVAEPTLVQRNRALFTPPPPPVLPSPRAPIALKAQVDAFEEKKAAAKEPSDAAAAPALGGRKWGSVGEGLSSAEEAPAEQPFVRRGSTGGGSARRPPVTKV